jgi:hypothetical protein
MAGKTFKFVMPTIPNVPNANGHIYSDKVIDDMIKKAEERPVHVFLGYNQPRSLDKICGVVKKIERNKGRADVTIEPLDSAKDVVALLEAGLVEITPAGRGSVDANGNVSNYELTEFSLVHKTPISEELNEATIIISEALNEAATGILFSPHERGAIFAQYDKTAPDGHVGYWLTYDPEFQRVTINPMGTKIDMFDPSSVDKLIQALEELRTP